MNLRKALSSIFYPPEGARCLNQEFLEVCIKEVEQLKKKYSHSIRLFEKVYPAEKRLICYTYAIGLSLEIVGECEWPVVFVRSLLDNKVLVEYDDGDVVLYWKEHRLHHAGIRDKNMVRSKWGGGHIWTHQPLEVPLQYGDPKYYIFKTEDKVGQEEMIEEEFKRYCDFACENLSCRKKA